MEREKIRKEKENHKLISTQKQIFDWTPGIGGKVRSEVERVMESVLSFCANEQEDNQEVVFTNEHFNCLLLISCCKLFTL